MRSRFSEALSMATRLIARRPIASAPMARAATLTNASAVATRAKANCEPVLGEVSDLSMAGQCDRSRLVLRCCLRALLEYANHPAQTKLVGHHAEAGRKKRFAKRHLHLAAIGEGVE